MVAPSSEFYTVSNFLLHKDVKANFSIANCMSQFSVFLPTKTTVKLANENMVHAQVIGIIVCHFPNFPIIYPVGTFDYCPGRPSNAISPSTLKLYVAF